jgi:thioredoxin reductase
MTPPINVLIAGAGIGGLTAAFAIADTLATGANVEQALHDCDSQRRPMTANIVRVNRR